MHIVAVTSMPTRYQAFISFTVSNMTPYLPHAYDPPEPTDVYMARPHSVSFNPTPHADHVAMLPVKVESSSHRHLFHVLYQHKVSKYQILH